MKASSYESRFKKRVKRKMTAIASSISKSRVCGDCTVLGVADLPQYKPPGVPCQHLSQTCSGCSIYDSRPTSCREYECLWRKGNISDEDMRPDKIGLIFDEAAEGRDSLMWKYRAITCREVFDGASEAPRARDLIAVLSAQVPVMIMSSDMQACRRLVGPPHIVRSILKDIEETQR